MANKNSFNDARKYIADNGSSVDHTKGAYGKFVYGWLLCARLHTRSPNFIIRSPLLNMVRRLIYKDIPWTLKQNVLPLHRLEYIALSQYF